MALLYLLLSILFSTVINLIFRWFKEYKVQKFQAIVINYLVCFTMGYSFSDHKNIIENMQAAWFPYCILLGFVFVGIFFSMALTTEKLGISVTAVSGKMSVVIPVLFAYLFLNESLTILFFIGLILSLLSIYFISLKQDLVIDRKYFMLPVVVFLGGGAIDTSLKVLTSTYVNVSSDTISYSIFLGAFFAGLSLFILRNKGNFKIFEFKSIQAGILLGVPNYFSIYFLLKAIGSYSESSALVFGLNNIGIVILSTLLSMLIFKETLSRGNKIGIAMALLSIVLIAYAS